ncbi:MAG: hypothetical protein DMG40_01035 [Acidobacteria bacterium]|nr:MAG: hypothetical protein DMG40_01035 [Acidobacteriota bacterium]
MLQQNKRLPVVLAILCLALVYVLAPDPGMAQERKGGITGKITDKGGGILQGARVTVEPGGISAVSDAQGDFLITGLAQGPYTVTVSYVGFTTFTKNVTVSAGQVANLNTQLAPASQNLEVLVTADRPSAEAEEVNRERAADNVVQVLTPVLGDYTSPMEANAVTEAQPRATPRTTPARTSLTKCMPNTTRDTAILNARKKSTPFSGG